MSEALTRMRSAMRTDGIDEQHAKSLMFWARSFLAFCEHDDPRDLGRSDVEGFLTHLSEDRYAGRASRQRVLEAIEYLFDNAGGGTPAWLKIFIEEHRSRNNPNILSPDEVRRFLTHLRGREWLAAALIYGTGIRLVECVRLRVRDVDLEADELLVRDAGGHTVRRLKLPANTQPRLQDQLENLKLMHIRDIVEGNGAATLPPPVAARDPKAARSWGWQYLFPQQVEQQRTSWQAPDGKQPIHHVDPQTFHRLFERGALEANIYRRVTGHVLRNSFALHMIRRGVPVKRVEQMLGTGADQSDNETAWQSLGIPAEAVPAELRVN
ncbi:MAG: tyrosine-type recombinase/integrase [Candidatus Wenzhouxiangella sp. M2_3B_020]